MDAQHESRVKALRELGRASDHMHLEMGKINRLVNEHAEKQQVLADDNYLMEAEFAQKLKGLEVEAVGIEAKIVALKQEKEGARCITATPPLAPLFFHFSPRSSPHHPRHARRHDGGAEAGGALGEEDCARARDAEGARPRGGRGGGARDAARDPPDAAAVRCAQLWRNSGASMVQFCAIL